jgi:diacylglycerol kinase family enzyme
MAPAAAPNDGLLDVMCAPLASPDERLNLAACMFLRCLHLSPMVSYVRGRRVRVTSERPDVPFEVDGEAAGILPAEIEIDPAAVRVLAPPTFRPIRRGLR